jgi:peptide/histidine transporter 3/4
MGRKNIIRDVCIYILATEMCERLCYYGLSGSLKTYLNQRLGYPLAQSNALSSVLPAFVYVSPLLGGYVADVHLGRYKTILVFGLIYVIGTVLVSVAAYPGSERRELFMFALFGLVGIGSGGIKANVVTMGGDQFDSKKPLEAAQKDSFFNYFYWSINLGAIISFGYIAQLATNGQASLSIKPEEGFFASFLICAAALAIALMAFVWARERYICKPPAGSAIAEFCSDFVVAARATYEGTAVLLALVMEMVGFILATASAFVSDTSVATLLSYGGCGLCVVAPVIIVIFCRQPEWVGKREYVALGDECGSVEEGGASIARTKALLRILPTLMLSQAFWVVYGQMNGNFYSQACQMDLRYGAGEAQLNGSILNIADSVTIIICIPLFDSYIYPLIERCKGSKFSPHQKVGCGFVTGLLAMVAASLIELERRRSPIVMEAAGPIASLGNSTLMGGGYNGNTTGGVINTLVSVTSNCAAVGVPMSDMSAGWMVIPFALIGISECLISVPLTELCYSEVPAELRSTAQALNLFMTACSGAMTAAVTVAFSEYTPQNLNDGHMEFNYYAGAVLAAVALPVFVHVAYHFKSINVAIPSDSLLEDDHLESIEVIEGDEDDVP